MGNVVKEFKIGNTQIKICDDYCRDKTPEDVKRILEKIATRLMDECISIDTAKRIEKDIVNDKSLCQK